MIHTLPKTDEKFTKSLYKIHKKSVFDRLLSSLLVDNVMVYTLQPHRIGHKIAHVRHRVAGGARQDAS